MANTNWAELKRAVTNSIKANGNQEITGQILQGVILQVINALGENATFCGIAYTDTNPGVPNGPVFYIASTPGIYPNFNSLEVTNEAAIFRYSNGVWQKLSTGLAISADIANIVYASNVGYYVCNSSATSVLKIISSSLIEEHPMLTGASIKVKMLYATNTNGATIKFGEQGPSFPLFYNGKVASRTNTWADNEIIEVWTDSIRAYAKKWESPTVQTSWNTGSEYTYIYSKPWVAGENNDKCVLAEGTCLEQHNGQLKMRNKFWGGSTSGGATYGLVVPVASSEADGAMSKEDKIFLDSLRKPRFP